MKLTCKKSDLIEALSLGQRALSPNSSLEAIKGFLISCGEDEIDITAYNLETGIVTLLPAQATPGESTVINGRVLFDIVRRLPDETVTIQTDDKNVAMIRSGSAEFNIMTLPAAEFPDLPNIDPDRTFTLPQGLLKNMISETIFAASQSEYKPILTGSCFDVRGNTLRLVAADSSRISLREEEIEGFSPDGEDHIFVVPAAAMREVEKILKDGEEEKVRLSLSRKHILFDMGNTRLFCRLLEGEYTKYESVIPKESRYSVIIGKNQMTASLDRVSILINEQMKTPVRLAFDENLIRFSARTVLGNAYDECVASGGADGMEIGFSSRFLSDAIRAIDDEEAEVLFSSPLTPFVIRPIEGKRFLHVIAPTRLPTQI